MATSNNTENANQRENNRKTSRDTQSKNRLSQSLVIGSNNTMTTSSTPAPPPAGAASGSHHRRGSTSGSGGFKIISNKERQKEFDQAVKEVIRQRKQVVALQAAALKAQKAAQAERRQPRRMSLNRTTHGTNHVDSIPKYKEELNYSNSNGSGAAAGGGMKRVTSHQEFSRHHHSVAPFAASERPMHSSVNFAHGSHLEALARLREGYINSHPMNHGGIGGLRKVASQTYEGPHDDHHPRFDPNRRSSSGDTATANGKSNSNFEFPRPVRRELAPSQATISSTDVERNNLPSRPRGNRRSHLSKSMNAVLPSFKLEDLEPTKKVSSGDSVDTPKNFEDAIKEMLTLKKEGGDHQQQQQTFKTMYRPKSKSNLRDVEGHTDSQPQAPSQPQPQDPKENRMVSLTEILQSRPSVVDDEELAISQPMRQAPNENGMISLTEMLKERFKDTTPSTSPAVKSVGSSSIVMEPFNLEDLVPTKKLKTHGIKKMSMFNDVDADKKGLWDPGAEGETKEDTVDIINGEAANGKLNHGEGDLVSEWKQKSLSFDEESLLVNGGEGRKLGDAIEVVGSRLSDPAIILPISAADESAVPPPTADTQKPTKTLPSDDCPRANFLLKSKWPSNSGATGRTESSKSMFSSDSIGSNNLAANGHAICTVGSVIQEEELRSSGVSARRSSGEHSTLSLSKNASANASDLSCAKSQNSRTSTRSRLSVFKGGRGGARGTLRRLFATSSTMGAGKGKQQEEQNYANLDQFHANQEGPRRTKSLNNFGRKSSQRSLASNISAITSGTATNDDKSSNKWKLGLGRATSTKNINAHSGPPTRVFVTSNFSDGLGRRQSNENTERDSVSHISNISHRSSRSMNTDDGSQSSKFTEFYDNNIHVNTVSRVLLKASSKRSMHSSLDPVVEQAEGEKEAQTPKEDDNSSSNSSAHTLYRFPSYSHDLVHVCPKALFPDSPGWQCDECAEETFDSTVWAYVSIQQNYLICSDCFSKTGFRIDP